MNSKTDQGKKPKARGGWDEEDTTKVTKPSQTSTLKVKTLEEFRRPLDKQLITQSQSIEIESKIIEDILTPTGITVKPNDNQLAEFLKRIKNLNKDIISRIIIEKIKINESSSDPTSNKVLMVKVNFIFRNLYI